MKGIYLVMLVSGILTGCSLPSQNNIEEDRFTEVVLAQGLDEPMAMTFLPGNKVLVIERKGGVKLILEDTKETIFAGWIEVNTKYTNKEGQTREAEEGVMGVIVDPNYAENNWIYIYFADPETPKHVLARYEFRDDYLLEDSKTIVLEVPTQREECCHTGGGMTWDAKNNLYLSVGNNTVNPRSGASNMNELPGHENEDDQRAPSNTMDLRGKIVRIHPEDDGTYSVPEGNLFAKGTEKTRPEIYTMGHRNPWRVSIDSKTGYLYWGEVGPDASEDSNWGPKGYDEFNQAKKAGNFGWPYFIGNNRPYNKFNSVDGTYGEAFDANNVINESVNNTGIKKLPQPVPAFLYYPYGASEEFPLLGTSGRSATGGPVFRSADFKKAERPWSSYFEGKWLITEFMRGWLIAVTMDENGDYLSMEKVVSNKNFSGAIDMDFGPSGDLYVLQYGTAWFRKNANSRLVRIEYNKGNRKPNVEIASDVSSGKLPLTVNLTAEGSKDSDDYDDGKLSYQWTILKGQDVLTTLEGEVVSYTFNQGGDFEAKVTVKDSKGDKNEKSILITAGNTAPEISLDLKSINKSFYFGENILDYSVSVKDDEDGQIGEGIKSEEVAVTFDYVPAGYDPIDMAASQASADELASFAVGINLIKGSDCISCHQFNGKSIGPSYVDVANRYKNTDKNRNYLVDKILIGGSGVWGEHGMSAHPDLDRNDAARMVDYIIGNPENNNDALGTKGTLKPESPDFELEAGSYVLRASYKDKGTDDAKSLRTEELIVLKSPFLKPHNADYKKSTEILTAAGNAYYAVGDSSYIGYKSLDLNKVSSIVVYIQNSRRSGAKGGHIELRLKAPDGDLVARSTEIVFEEKEQRRRSPAGTNPVEWRRQNSLQAVITLPTNISGFQDVFFVFRNEKAISNEYLMQVLETGFMEK